MTLGDVLPAFTTADTGDCRKVNTKQRSKIAHMVIASSIQAADFLHGTFSQFGAWVCRTLQSGQFVCRSGYYRIAKILGIGAHIQMCRIAARSIVAAVTDEHAVWNWTINELISHSVRLSTLIMGDREDPISKICVGHPGPAFIRRADRDVFPETLRDGNGAVTRTMAVDKLHRLADDHISFRVFLSRQCRFLSAPTMAVFKRDRVGIGMLDVIFHTVESFLASVTAALCSCQYTTTRRNVQIARGARC